MWEEGHRMEAWYAREDVGKNIEHDCDISG